MKSFALFVALVALAHSPLASGSKGHLPSDPVAQAVHRAVEFWGSSPCGGSVGIVGGTPEEAPQSGENAKGERVRPAAMWASWTAPTGINSFSSPPQTFGACVVHINLRVWPDWLTDDANFRAFCKEMVHEYGHLEGHPDEGALIGTVEYEQPEYAQVPICERFRLVYGTRVFARPVPPAGRRRGRGRG